MCENFAPDTHFLPELYVNSIEYELFPPMVHLISIDVLVNCLFQFEIKIIKEKNK